MLSSFDSKAIRSIINGKAREADRTMPILNPHDGCEIGRLHLAGAEEISEAIAVAREAQKAWAALPAVQRGAILYAACNLIEQRSDELSTIVAAEAGKAMKDAGGETGAALLCGRFFAGEGQRLFGRTMPSGAPNKSAMTVRQPCGVAGLITAANTPAPNFAWKVFPALICGNAVVLKPAEDTPGSAEWMARALIEAGVPPGVLNVVQGLGPDVGPPLYSNDGVDVVSFTGSTQVGRMIAKRCGHDLRKLSLELGGKNAFIVCDDADLDKAAQWAAASAFSNAGQRCAAGSRFLVFDGVYDAFMKRFVGVAAAQKLGVSEDCTLGPVINTRQLERMCHSVSEAVAGGARLHFGGARARDPDLAAGFYMQPTILDNVAHDAAMSRDELFGPVGVVYRVADYAEAMAIANDSPYGLTAAIHTRSWDRAWRFAQDVSTGVAVVNAGTFGSEPHMPFGGLRASGNGTREPGTEALDVYTELKDIYLITEPERL